MDSETIERLETKLAYLERATTELSDVVFRQQQDIALLNEKVLALSSRFDAFRQSDRPYTAEEERPPHY